MNIIPKGMQIQDSDVLTKIEIKNFDDTLLLMQIILMLMPLLAINGYVFFNSIKGLVLSFPVLIALIYWIIYNIKDSYLIFITNKSVLIYKGMHKSEIVNLNLNDIEDIFMTTKYGKVLTSARTGLSSKTPDINELKIRTHQEEILVTNSLPYSNQVFIKNQIMKKLKDLFVI
jgi:hypothetical protein